MIYQSEMLNAVRKNNKQKKVNKKPKNQSTGNHLKIYLIVLKKKNYLVILKSYLKKYKKRKTKKPK